MGLMAPRHRNPAPLAVAILAAALGAAPPAFAVVPHEVAIARGIRLVTDGKYREALGPLDEALAAAPDNAEALFYAGVAHSRLGEYAAAERLMRRALGEVENAEVLYELGRVAALTGRCTDAERMLGRSAGLDPAGAAARDQAGLLSGCRAHAGGPAFEAALSVGWQHDSNVVLDPDNPVRERDRVADNRAVSWLSLGGRFLRGAPVELDARYALYASRHANIGDYDAVYHRLAPTLVVTAWDAVQPSLGYVYEHTSFGGDTYGEVHTGVAKVAVAEGDGLSTEGSFSYRDSRYSGSDLFPDNADRTGTGWGVELRQGLERGAISASLAAGYDRDGAREDWWASRAWRAAAGLTWRVADPLQLGVTGEYRAVDYDDPATGGGEAREDRISQVAAALTWSPCPYGSVSLTASHTRDSSNLDAFTYRRTVYGILVTARL